MRSNRLLAKVFAFIFGVFLVSSVLGTAQHARAFEGAAASVAGMRVGPLGSNISEEVIMNGGFESGDLTGWSVTPGEGSVSVTTTNPHGGEYCACAAGSSLYQYFQGIPTSSVQSITYCKRTEEPTTLAIMLYYADSWDEIWENVTNSWSFFDVTSQLETDKVLLGIGLPGWWNATGAPVKTFYDDVSIIARALPPALYNLTINAHCNTEGVDVSVGIMEDGSATVFSTPHTFSGLNGSHTFTVPSADVGGHSFSQSSTGQTSTTITVSDGGTYTAIYDALASFENVIRVPEDYKSVQTAIDAAAQGSTIIIAPGVYNESIIVNKTLTIVGRLGSEPIFNGSGSGIAITLLPGASGSLVTGIVITSWDEGILIENASGCKIYGNVMSFISNDGIILQGADAVDNQVYSNIFSQDAVAVDVTSGAFNSTISQNVISQSTTGLKIEAGGNTICGNMMSENQVGINITNANDNKVFHNTFEGTAQVSIIMSTGNVWDDGYPSGGNFWSGHTGPDLYNGPNQDQPGSDGIVDTPYTVAIGNVDKYPLVHGAHDVGITSVSTSKTVVGKGYILHVKLRILNYGVYDENFQVAAYANTFAAVTQTIALARGSYVTITLTWNTSSYACGNYTISAYSQPVPSESDTADNTYVAGSVTVAIPGDVNADGKVNIVDISTAARSFGSKDGEKRFVPNVDTNEDEVVNVIDISTIAKEFGKTG